MSISLHDIVTEEFQKEIQDSFAYATGFGVMFIDPEGKHIGKGGNFTRFCTAINNKREWAQYCELSNRQAIALAMGNNTPSIYICHAGLVNIEIPLIFEGHHVGAITAGQVLASDPDYYPRDTVSSKIDWLDNPELAEYFKDIKTLSIQQIEATTTALANMSNYIVQRYAYAKMQEDLLKKENELLLYQKKQLESEHQLMQARFDALQKQVMPHFIFNVINSMHRLISMKNYKTAKEKISSFSFMMRYTLSNLQSTVSLEQEMDFIRHYLMIQKIRFNDRLEYDLQCNQEMKSLQIPFFSIQPLVENSIEHGVLKLPSGGKILFSCHIDEGEYRILIRDNGVGIGKKRLDEIRKKYVQTGQSRSGEHLGVYNCYNRFKLMYGTGFRLDMQSREEGGLEVVIAIARNAALFAL